MSSLCGRNSSATDKELKNGMGAAGWLNVLGQFASTAGSGYLTAIHLGEIIQLSSGHVMTKQDDFLVYSSELWQPILTFPQLLPSILCIR